MDALEEVMGVSIGPCKVACFESWNGGKGIELDLGFDGVEIVWKFGMEVDDDDDDNDDDDDDAKDGNWPESICIEGRKCWNEEFVTEDKFE